MLLFNKFLELFKNELFLAIPINEFVLSTKFLTSILLLV